MFASGCAQFRTTLPEPERKNVHEVFGIVPGYCEDVVGSRKQIGTIEKKEVTARRSRVRRNPLRWVSTTPHCMIA